MPLVMMQELVFPNSMHMKKVCNPDVVLRINGCVIADCQWPIIIGTNKWFPNAVDLIRADT
jgi:hypothetical protein